MDGADLALLIYLEDEASPEEDLQRRKINYTLRNRGTNEAYEI